MQPLDIETDEQRQKKTRQKITLRSAAAHEPAKELQIIRHSVVRDKWWTM